MRDLHDAGLQELHFVAAERLQHEVHAVGEVPDVGLALADADRLDHHAVEQAREQAADLEARRPEPAEVGVGGLAAEEQASLVGRKRMRVRSPSSAPPETWLDGSTASTAIDSVGIGGEQVDA